MTNDPPDVWPPNLSPKQDWDAECSFSFRSCAWKSKGDRRAKPIPPFPRPFTPGQVQALFQAASRSTYPARDVALLRLFLETGMRVSELAELTWQDFRLEKFASFVWVFGWKNRPPRLLPVSTQLRDGLLRYKATAAQEAPALPSQEAAQQSNTFDLAQHEPRRHHQPDYSRNRRAICKLLKRLAQESGIDPEAGSITLRLRATWIQTYLSLFPGNLAGLARMLGVSLQTATRYQLYHTGDMEIMLRYLHHTP